MTKDADGHGSAGRGGFDSKIYYHGSSDHDIKTWDPDKTKRGVLGRGIYVTRRKDLAAEYAGKEGRVYPVQLDRTRTLDITHPEGQAEFKRLPEEELRKKYDVVRAPGQSVVLNGHAIRHAEPDE